MITNFLITTALGSDEQEMRGIIGTLPAWDTSVSADGSAKQIFQLFDTNAYLPGVLVMDENKLIGLIPRELAFEKLGRPFGVELFLKLTNRQFHDSINCSTLVLSSEMKIEEAVKQALRRSQPMLYAPIVVKYPSSFGILTMYNLLTKQQNILHDLYTEVYNLSNKDPLTTVNNRRGFFDAIHQKLAITRQLDLSFAFLMIDVDDFKKINDRYGHFFGDEVIKSIAHQFSSHINENDILARFGGEEFVIFLMDVSPNQAFERAETIRQDLASSFHMINGVSARVTISVGLSYSRGANRTLDQLLTEADKAVYAAKDRGKNKVVVWEESLQAQNIHAITRAVHQIQDEAGIYPIEQTLNGFLHMLYLRDYETESHTEIGRAHV